MVNIAYIAIGSELLNGKITNTNATAAGRLLVQAGFQLAEIITIPDTWEAILESLTYAHARHEVVLISGGLGPTKDDITKNVLAHWSASELVEHQPTLDFLIKRYASLDRPLTELTKAQAMVPAACTVIPNAQGTAPCMAFERDGKKVYSMPGVPFEMLHILEHEIIPRLQQSFTTVHPLRHLVRVGGLAESVAAQRMEALEEKLPPAYGVSYLPRKDGLWIELSTLASAEEQASAQDNISAWGKEIDALFTAEIFAKDDQPLEKILAEEFRTKGLTLAIAESLTGGHLAATVVSISGASTFFAGSVTAYAIPVKISVLEVPETLINDKGVVSAEVAQAMASGVRKLLKADVGLATTGWAQPEGETPAQAWIGYADAQGEAAKHVQLYHKRAVNIDRTAHHAMRFALKKVRDRLA